MQRAGAWTSVWSPITLARCAAILRDEAGYEARIVDGTVEDVTFESLGRLCDEWRPDLVLFNAVTPSFLDDMRTPAVVKASVPGAVVGCFSIHASVMPEYAFDHAPGLDMIVRGEPEDTVREIGAAVASGAFFGARPKIRGISWRADDRSMRHNPDRDFIRNLDALPHPAWDLVDVGYYRMPVTYNPFLLVGAGRGCPIACTFCVAKPYYGADIRYPSVAYTVDELERNLTVHGVKEALFWSESFTINRAYALGIAREMRRRRLPVKWVCNSRVTDVDEELLAEFKAAGCMMIGFGVESGNQEILDSMKKQITLPEIRRAFKITREAGIETVSHTQVGYPGESEETIRRTVGFVKEIDPDYPQFYCTTPLPGTPLYPIARSQGWIKTDDWKRFEQNFSVLDLPGLPAERVMSLRRWAYRSYYLRPRAIKRQLGKIKTLSDVKDFVGAVGRFLSWV